MSLSDLAATGNGINDILNRRGQTRKEMLDNICGLISYFELATVGVTILELAIWKVNMDEKSAKDSEARQACRESCGTAMNIIIKGVLQFFGGNI